MNTCAAHCVQFVGTRAREAGIKTLPAFDQFDAHKKKPDGSFAYANVDGARIDGALKGAFDPKDLGRHLLLLDNMSLLTDPEQRHVLLDAALAPVANGQGPLWIIVNTKEAGADNSKSGHWVTFELAVTSDPKSIKVLHRDSRISKKRAKVLQAAGHGLSTYCNGFLGWDGEGPFSESHKQQR